MRTLGLPLITCAALATGGCAREAVDLVDNAAWVLAADADDPWADLRPEGAGCEETGFGVEPPVFEVETGACNYGTFTQPLAAPVLQGDLVRLVAAHLPLVSDEGGEAMLALRVGATELAYTTDIPADETVMRLRATAAEEVAEGAPVFLHIHNHGANSWQFLEARAGPESAFEGVE